MPFVTLHDAIDNLGETVQRRVMPAKSVFQTVQAIRRFIQQGRKNPKIVLMARKIVRGIPGRDFDRIAERIYAFLIRTFKYHRDPHMTEWVQDAEASSEVFKSGDCDDFTGYSGSLLQALGIRTRIVIAAINGDKFNHVYSEYWSPGSKGWVPFDASIKKHVGWQSPSIVKRQVFAVD